MSRARAAGRARGHARVGPPLRRERLLKAIAEEVALRGYRATTIAQITARARVSRTTFYEHFTDKQDSFLAAYRELAEQLATSIEQSLEQRGAENAAEAALGALFELAQRQPNAAMILFHAPAAAGLPALDERAHLLSRIEQQLEDSRAGEPTQARLSNLPARALAGAAVRELAMRLHRGENSQELLDDLIRWCERYTTTGPNTSGAGSKAASPPTDARPRRAGLTPPVRRLSGLTASERIVRAVAELAERHSYPQITVAAIAAPAGVNRETFYKHFADKEGAYIAALRLVFERAIAATAAGFFGRSDWSERVWNGLRGLIEFLAGEPALAHIALAEPYAVGGEAIELIIEKQLAFALFLEEGYRCRPGAEHTRRSTSSLIVCAIFELLDRHLREQPEESLTVLIPQAAYIALAPFTGADAAAAFIERKVAESRSG